MHGMREGVSVIGCEKCRFFLPFSISTTSSWNIEWKVPCFNANTCILWVSTVELVYGNFYANIFFLNSEFYTRLKPLHSSLSASLFFLFTQFSLVQNFCGWLWILKHTEIRGIQRQKVSHEFIRMLNLLWLDFKSPLSAPIFNIILIWHDDIAMVWGSKRKLFELFESTMRELYQVEWVNWKLSWKLFVITFFSSFIVGICRRTKRKLLKDIFSYIRAGKLLKEQIRRFDNFFAVVEEIVVMR